MATTTPRAQAARSSKEMYASLLPHLSRLSHDERTKLTLVIERALSDEYEAGWDAGYNQHPDSRKPIVR